jgi:hypothetical protein
MSLLHFGFESHARPVDVVLLHYVRYAVLLRTGSPYFAKGELSVIFEAYNALE